MKAKSSVRRASLPQYEPERVNHPTRTTYQAHYPIEGFIVPILRQEIDRVIGEWSRVPGSRRVLDVGCGNQPYRRTLESLGFLYSSQDAFQTRSGQVDFVALFDQPLPPELKIAKKFQFILCTEVMEHMLDWHQAFQNFAKLLEKNGEVFITVPFVFPLHEEPHDFWRPTPHAIRALALANGLKIREERKLGNVSDVLGTLVGAALERMNYPQPSHFLERVYFSVRLRLLRAYLNFSYRFLQSKAGQGAFSSQDLYVSNSFRLVKA